MGIQAAKRRASIDVTLDAPEALALVEENFRRVPTASGRSPDRGWAIEREDGRMLITTADPKAFLLEPLPADYVGFFPEPLALVVVAQALPDVGSQVKARLIRHRFGKNVRAVFLDFLVSFNASTFLHGAELLTVLRHNRRAAKLRLLRLVVEPLAQYEKSRALGPFRS